MNYIKNLFNNYDTYFLAIGTFLFTIFVFNGCDVKHNTQKLFEEINNAKTEILKINVIRKYDGYLKLCIEGYTWLQYQGGHGSNSQMFVEDEKTGLAKPIKCTNF